MSFEPRDRFGYPRLDGYDVIVVDDHIDSAQFLVDLLGFCGARVWSVTSAAEAQHWLERRYFSLLICDFQMPGRTGVALAHWLRSQSDDRASIPAVAVTAYPKQFLAAENDGHVFDAFFVKPLDVPSFLRTIDAILSRSRRSGLRSRASAS